MDHLVVDGVPGYDGRYEYDMVDRPFTTREWGWIKKYSGYLPVTFIDGWRNGDAELLSVFAIIALTRNNKISRDQVPEVWERFGDAPGVTTVRLEFEDAEDEEGEVFPPPSPPSSDKNGSSSGPDSTTSSEASTRILPPTGTPASDSWVSHQET